MLNFYKTIILYRCIFSKRTINSVLIEKCIEPVLNGTIRKMNIVFLYIGLNILNLDLNNGLVNTKYDILNFDNPSYFK